MKTTLTFDLNDLLILAKEEAEKIEVFADSEELVATAVLSDCGYLTAIKVEVVEPEGQK